MIKAIAFAIMLFSTTGCYSWKRVSVVENPDASTRPSMVEVSLQGDAKYVIHHPLIRADSLTGWGDEKKTVPVSVAVKDIRSARTLQHDGPRTAALVVGLVAAFLVSWATLIAMNFDIQTGS